MHKISSKEYDKWIYILKEGNILMRPDLDKNIKKLSMIFKKIKNVIKLSRRRKMQNKLFSKKVEEK